MDRHPLGEVAVLDATLSPSLRCETPIVTGKTRIEPDYVAPSCQPRSTTLPRRLLLGDLGQVMHYYPPACPSSHAILAMVEAALQSVLPPEHADPSFDARSEREGPPEPSLLFVVFSLFRRPTALRQGDAPYARLFGGFFVGLRVQSTVGA
jgi:hypothetical protein